MWYFACRVRLDFSVICYCLYNDNMGIWVQYHWDQNLMSGLSYVLSHWRKTDEHRIRSEPIQTPAELSTFSMTVCKCVSASCQLLPPHYSRPRILKFELWPLALHQGPVTDGDSFVFSRQIIHFTHTHTYTQRNTVLCRDWEHSNCRLVTGWYFIVGKQCVLWQSQCLILTISVAMLIKDTL